MLTKVAKEENKNDIEDIEELIKILYNVSIEDIDISEEEFKNQKIVSAVPQSDKILYTLNDKTTTTSVTNEMVYEYLENEKRAPISIIYTRVSAQSSTVLNPCSLAFQLETCLKDIKSTVVQINEGVRSAFKNGQKHLNILKKFLITGDTIYVYEINRLSRNLETGLEIMNYCLNNKIKIIGVNDNITLSKLPADIKRFQEALINANYESSRLSYRTKKTIKKIKKEGHSFGKVPYGMKRIKTTKGIRKNIIDEQENKALEIITKYNEKGYTPDMIICKLVKNGYKYRNKDWTKNAIKYLIKREENKISTKTDNTSDEEFEEFKTNNKLFKTETFVNRRE